MVIENGLKDGLSFKAIAKSIDRDCTTISKEVRNHLKIRKVAMVMYSITVRTDSLAADLILYVSHVYIRKPENVPTVLSYVHQDVLILLRRPVLSFQNHLTYAMDVLTETGAPLQNITIMLLWPTRIISLTFLIQEKA